MKKLTQQFSVPYTYQVFFTRGLFRRPDSPILDVVKPPVEGNPSKMIVVLDEGVKDTHPELIEMIEGFFRKHSDQMQLCGKPVVVPGGEIAKNETRYLELLLQSVNEEGIDRHSYMIAIGGGAVLDLAGYAAAIAHRGIRLIRVPTTVLSQNDSGVGVKNGINYFGKKNFLGTFVPPVAVLNDYDFLETLEDRDWRSGISEAVKVALIKDAAFFTFLENNAKGLAAREAEPMEYLIEACAALHLDHIAGGDPFESGSSRPLDFGHWAGHKLEQMTGYKLRHGEAVAIGIALDVTYAFLKGMIRQPEWERVINLLQDLGFDLYVPELGLRHEGQLVVLEGLEEFRQHLGGQLTIMLVDSIGQGIEVHEMDTELLTRAVAQLHHLHEAATV